MGVLVIVLGFGCRATAQTAQPSLTWPERVARCLLSGEYTMLSESPEPAAFNGECRAGDTRFFLAINMGDEPATLRSFGGDTPTVPIFSAGAEVSTIASLVVIIYEDRRREFTNVIPPETLVVFAATGPPGNHPYTTDD